MFNPLSTTTTTIIPLRKKTALLKNNSQNDRNIHFHLITFPNGISVEEYGLPIIKTLQDIENLPKFEVIRYLQGFDIEYNNNNVLSEIHLRNLLKDRLIIEMNYLNGGVKKTKWSKAKKLKH
ncbi:conserved hypothetical protein [Candida albicans WO-1]|uniref:Mug135-like C-terminal domain-containing protein n=1 Tax=Candida albicans (strain WO-1) TaxID=294748 RepID=C4YM86_CANAW|nr:conserved hypothetical protein [Candida albicans WO-1]